MFTTKTAFTTNNTPHRPIFMNLGSNTEQFVVFVKHRCNKFSQKTYITFQCFYHVGVLKCMY